MTRTFARTAAVALAALTIGSAPMTAPAFAGGSISLSFGAANSDDAEALRLGLGLYALANGIKAGKITQNGMNNAAGLLQNGQGNLGIVHQEGNGHNGTVEQYGNGNACGVFQFGRGTDAHCRQYGDANAGAMVTYGW